MFRRRFGGIGPALWPALLAVAGAVFFAIKAHGYFMQGGGALVHAHDEGYVSAFARRMLEGQNLPYVDGVSHRGPVFYWVSAAVVRLFGFDTWMPMRALALGSMLVTILSGFAAAALAKRALAGAIMAVCYVAICAVSMQPLDGLSFNSEHLLNAFATTSFLCLVLASRADRHKMRLVWVFLAGVLTACSGLSKQVGFVMAVPLSFWVLRIAFAGGASARRKRWLVPASYALGILLPILALITRYALAGELRALYYYLVSYNVDVYRGALVEVQRDTAITVAVLVRFDFLLIAAPLLGCAIALLVTAALAPFGGAPLWHGKDFDASVVLALVGSLLFANTSFRDFAHYYVQVIPWASLAGGVLLERSLGAPGLSINPARDCLVRTLVLVPLGVMATVGWLMKRAALDLDPSVQGKFHSERWPICQFVREHSKPSQSIFVWGFDPAPYTACNRRPASRYVFTTFVAGFVPWIPAPREVEEARVAPHSREILLSELEREKPAIIFDSPNSMNGHSLRDYDFLREFVDANYCRTPAELGPVAYTLKTSACPKDGH